MIVDRWRPVWLGWRRLGGERVKRPPDSCRVDCPFRHGFAMTRPRQPARRARLRSGLPRPPSSPRPGWGIPPGCRPSRIPRSSDGTTGARGRSLAPSPLSRREVSATRGGRCYEATRGDESGVSELAPRRKERAERRTVEVGRGSTHGESVPDPGASEQMRQHAIQRAATSPMVVSCGRTGSSGRRHKLRVARRA